MFMSSHFWWNMNHKSSKLTDPILAPVYKAFPGISNVMFITPNELTVMYQLWSRLSGKGLLESCAVIKNGLSNTNFLGTCSFMKMGSCGLTNSLSQLYTSPSSRMTQFRMPSYMFLHVVPMQTMQS
jgi:hypothetical protein